MTGQKSNSQGHVFSVGQVNKYIKGMFASDFMLQRIAVKGEVSNCRYHTSGHIYFSLKDAGGSISCVMFAGSRAGLGFRMQDGQSVVVRGSISVYERDGKYQLYAEQITCEGAGLLYEQFEALKKELEEMGMFDQSYKKPIPSFARRIGVVTAPTGAAVRDIQNISARRNPYVQMILYPALVQGREAAPSIVRGIEALDKLGVDLIIVGRGGGSIEDLWAFNEKSVAYAIFQCRTPVISAVGHETDFTIADFVADLRAPTPSAAAELAVKKATDIQEALDAYRTRMNRRMQYVLERAEDQTKSRLKRLALLSPESRIREGRQHLMEKEERLQERMDAVLRDRRHKLQLYVERMRGLSPLDKLQQGYSYVTDAQKKVLTQTGQVKPGDELLIYVTDGRIRALAQDAEKITWR